WSITLRTGRLLGSATADSNGTYQVSLGSPAAGSYALVALAQDTAGNHSTFSAPLAPPLVLDFTPPAVPSIPDLLAADDTGASNTDNVTSVATPRFQGTAEAGAIVKILANGTIVGQAA